MWDWISSIGSSIYETGSKALDWAWNRVASEATGKLVESVAGAAIGAAVGYGAASLFAPPQTSAASPVVDAAAVAPVTEPLTAAPVTVPTVPKIAEIPELPKTVLETGRGTEASTAVKDAENKTRAALAANRGRSATMFTGPLGIKESPTVRRKQLLGA